MGQSGSHEVEEKNKNSSLIYSMLAPSSVRQLASARCRMKPESSSRLPLVDSLTNVKRKKSQLARKLM